jgi:hypothetical protein
MSTEGGTAFRASEFQQENEDISPARRPNEEPDFASAYCPRCSARLEQRSCKMTCPTCGYYMSCSDFY